MIFRHDKVAISRIFMVFHSFFVPADHQDDVKVYVESIEPTFNPSTVVMCPPFRTRGILWNWTMPEEVAVAPCPKGSTGVARFTCTKNGYWELNPNMTGCKSTAVTRLEASMRDQEPESSIMTKLAHLTQKPSLFLYGGDIQGSVEIMRTVAQRLQYLMQTQAESFLNQEFYIQEILQNMLRSGSNLLKDDKIGSWMEMSKDQRSKIITNLLLALEESAFLMADVNDNPEILEENAANISEYYHLGFLTTMTNPSCFTLQSWPFPSWIWTTSTHREVMELHSLTRS